MDRTVIVVAADHGESLGEHGEDGHGMLVYQSTLRVPLLMRMPGVSPRRVNDLVRLVDVMPTVLGALGLATPRLDGVSLLPLMSGVAAHVELEAYSESLYPRRFGWSELRALRDGRFNYVSGPRPELFDLANDPSELRNVYEERRSLAAVMAARLSTLGASNTGRCRPIIRARSRIGRAAFIAGLRRPGADALERKSAPLFLCSRPFSDRASRRASSSRWFLRCSGLRRTACRQ